MFFISYLPTSPFIHLVFCFSSLSHIIIMLLSLFFLLSLLSSYKKMIAIFSLIIHFVCFFQNWLTFSCTLALRPYLPLPMLPPSLIHTCSVKFPLIFFIFHSLLSFLCQPPSTLSIFFQFFLFSLMTFPIPLLLSIYSILWGCHSALKKPARSNRAHECWLVFPLNDFGVWDAGKIKPR